MTAHAKWEYLKMIYPRYRPARRPEKQQTLDERCRITGYHRKHATDNIFCQCHTWLQEGDPDRWYAALDSLGALREDAFVPGHGPVCDKRYLGEQRAFIQEWVDYVKSAAGKGMTKDDAVQKLTAMTDRYPMDVEQDGMAPRVMQMNVANLYDDATSAGIHQRGAWGA